MNIYLNKEIDQNETFLNQEINQEDQLNELKENDDNKFEQNEFKEKLEEELKNFHNDLMSIISEDEELKKIQDLILYLKCSNQDQASEIKCTYYIGEMIENVQYLKTTNSIYNVGMIFDLFVKVSSNLNDQLNFNYLIEVYNEIQNLIQQISAHSTGQIEVNLLSFKENKNFITRIIILLETSKVINHYKSIINENSLINSSNIKANPNPLMNLVAIQTHYLNYSKLPVSTKIKLSNLMQIYKRKEGPSFLINLVEAKLNQSLKEKFEITSN